MEAQEIACSECPFRRISAPGYLGASSYNPQSFLGLHWILEPVRLPCHMKIDWEAPNAQMQAHTAPLCMGLLCMMKNCAHLPIHHEIQSYLRHVRRDTENFFVTRQEFIDHHGRL